MPIHIGLGVGLTMGGGVNSPSLPFSLSVAPIVFGSLAKLQNASNAKSIFSVPAGGGAGLDILFAANNRIDLAQVIAANGTRSGVYGVQDQSSTPSDDFMPTIASPAANAILRTDLLVNSVAVMRFQGNSQYTIPNTVSLAKANHSVFLISAPEVSTMPVINTYLGASNDVKFGPQGSASGNPMGLTVVETSASRFIRSSLIPESSALSVMGYSSGADGVRMILNNTTELVTSTPLATATIVGGLYGDQVNYHNHHTICIFAQSLTDAQMKDISRTLQAAIIPPVGVRDTLLVPLGDSRTAGQGSFDNLNMVAQLLPTLANPTRYKCYNCAESGQPIAAQYANRALLDKLVADNPTLSRKILIINNDGINDDRGSTLATTTLANHRNLAAYAQALGFYVISTTCAADGSTLGLANKAITDARNASLNADHTAFNAFYDLSSQGYASNPNDTTYYNADKLHHTNAFYALNAAALKPLADAAP